MDEKHQAKGPSRRDFLKAGAGALGSLGVVSNTLGATLSGTPGGAPRPNFVFFLG